MNKPVWVKNKAKASRWECVKGYCERVDGVWHGFAFGWCHGHFFAGSSATLETVKCAVHRLWLDKGHPNLKKQGA